MLWISCRGHTKQTHQTTQTTHTHQTNTPNNQTTNTPNNLNNCNNAYQTTRNIKQNNVWTCILKMQKAGCRMQTCLAASAIKKQNKKSVDNHCNQFPFPWSWELMALTFFSWISSHFSAFFSCLSFCLSFSAASALAMRLGDCILASRSSIAACIRALIRFVRSGSVSSMTTMGDWRQKKSEGKKELELQMNKWAAHWR